MQVNISSLVYLVAASQALILIFVILKKKKVSISEKYLTAVLITLILTLIHYVGLINQFFTYRSILVDFSALSWYCISPLLFLYSKSLVSSNFGWKWKYLLYFPFSLYLFVQMILIAIGIRIGLFQLFSNIDSYTIAWILAYLVNSLFFSILSIRVLTAGNISKKQQSLISWIIRFFQVFSLVLILLIGMLLYWLNVDFFFNQLEYFLLLSYAIFIFSLITISLRFSHYFNKVSNDHYSHDQKNEEELAVLLKTLNFHLEDQALYLQPKLSLKDLSKATDISENQLSQIFNRLLNSSFYQYINTYRLKEFEQQLIAKGSKRYTIMALAELSGFASKATFYKVFKEHYKMTPSEFIKLNSLKSKRAS